MNLINIIAIDRDSSDYRGRTLPTNNAEVLRESLEEFEDELHYRKYELICTEDVGEYSEEIIEVLDEFGVTF